VNGNAPGQASATGDETAGVQNGGAVQGAALVFAEKERGRGSEGPIVVAQDLQELWREHDVAVLLALALADAQNHAFAVDVLGAKGDNLGDAQAAGIDGREQGPVLESADGREELSNFGLAEDDGQPFGLLLTGEAVEVPVTPQGDAVEEDQGAADLVEQAEGNLLLDEVDEEGTHLLTVEAVG
jgi:hypothetical protein